MTWETVALGELIVPAMVKRAGASIYPLLSMTMHDGVVDQAHRFKKRIASSDLSAYKVVERGQLVVGFPIDEGVLDFQELYQEGIVSPAYAVWNIKDGERVCRSYLKRALRSPQAISYYKQKLRGSTARRRWLPNAQFLRLPVHLPSFDEQRRIAAILDRVDEIRAKRRSQLTHLDELPQALFTEAARHAPATRSMKELQLDFETGKNVVASESNAHPTNRVLKVNAISSGEFLPDETKSMPHDYSPPPNHEVRAGDILFGRASGSLSLLGATTIVQSVADSVFLPDKIWRLVVPPRSQVLPQWVFASLRSAACRHFIEHNASGAAGVRNIGKRAMLSYCPPLPPLAEQQAFAEKVEAIQTERSRVARALEADDELFSALQYRAFRGEL